ncbi:MAG: hypothetical protein WBW85_06785 [Terriglobales bacterium]
MKKFPKSILLFLFTGIVCLAQHVPYLGVFLMVFGAPLWSVVTINLGFLLMVKEAWDGTLPRAVVVLPLLYFSIYAGITIAGHRQLSRLRQEIAQNNQAMHVAFDPKQNDLVVETKVVKGSTSPLGNVPEELVEAYDIPVAYGDNGNPRVASHVSYRVVAKKTCDAIRQSDPNVVTLSFQENGAFNFNLCLLRQPEDPKKPVLTVAVEEAVETQDWVLPTKVSAIRLTYASNQSFTLKGGTAAPFTWFPAPVIGCALDSAAPQWRCFAEFARDAYAPLTSKNIHDLGHNANTAAIAAALGLVAMPASSRIDETASDPAAAQNLQLYQEKEHDNELKRFHDLVTDLALPDWQFPYLLQHPELTAADAPAMVQALQRAEEVTTTTRGGREHNVLKYHNNNIRFVLSEMIVRLPEDAYAPLAPQLVEAARADANNTESGVGWSLQSQAPAFMMRLGDAAPAEMAELFAATLQAEHVPRDAQTTAVLGLCRAGAEYAPKVKDDLLRLFASTSRYNGGSMYLHPALYLTLLRMGMKDAVVNDPTEGRRDRIFQWYQDKFATVTPQSPKEVCVAVR